MHNHYFTLKRQVDFLKARVSGAKIVDSFTQEKNEWIVKLQSGTNGAGFLILSCEPQCPSVIFRESLSRRSLSTRLFDELSGRTIQKFELLPGNRIIEVTFEHPNFRLVLQLFTNSGNFFLVNRENRILKSFKKSKQLSGQHYQVRESTRSDPFRSSQADFREALLSEEKQTISGALKKQFLFLTPTIRQELFSRTGIDPHTPLKEMGEKEILLLWDTARQFKQQFETEPARIYFEESQPVYFTLGAFSSLSHLEWKTYSSINDALEYFCRYRLKQKSFLQKKTQLRERLRKRREALSRSMAQLASRLPDPSQKEVYQKMGQLLLAQPASLIRGQRYLELKNFFEPDTPLIRIPIDPSISIQENANRYFEKAKNFQRKMKRREKHLQSLKHLNEQIGDFLKELENIRQPQKLAALELRLKRAHLLQPETAEAAELRLPYKQFQYRGFDIWVGRSARDNNEMTFRYAHKLDWWLHVQGYRGAHVIIRNPKKSDPLPQPVLEFAARLAVTFSDAKHASYVPVVYTQVRYLRKPRKAPPGTVIPSRTKTIFADPFSENP